MLSAVCGGEEKSGRSHCLLGSKRLHSKVRMDFRTYLHLSVGWEAVHFCVSEACLASSHFTPLHMTMLTMTPQQTSFPNAIQGKRANFITNTIRLLLTTYSDGTFPASRTQRTRTPPSSPAYMNYGSRTTPRRTWWKRCRMKASPSTTAS